MLKNPLADDPIWVRIWVGWEYVSMQNFYSNFLALKQKKSSENRVVFGIFMVAEAGLELVADIDNCYKS